MPHRVETKEMGKTFCYDRKQSLECVCEGVLVLIPNESGSKRL